MIKFTKLKSDDHYYIAKWAIQAIWQNENATIIEIDNNSFHVKETVEEALKLWETTE